MGTWVIHFTDMKSSAVFWYPSKNHESVTSQWACNSSRWLEVPDKKFQQHVCHHRKDILPGVLHGFFSGIFFRLVSLAGKIDQPVDQPTRISRKKKQHIFFQGSPVDSNPMLRGNLLGRSVVKIQAIIWAIFQSWWGCPIRVRSASHHGWFNASVLWMVDFLLADLEDLEDLDPHDVGNWRPYCHMICQKMPTDEEPESRKNLQLLSRVDLKMSTENQKNGFSLTSRKLASV